MLPVYRCSRGKMNLHIPTDIFIPIRQLFFAYSTRRPERCTLTSKINAINHLFRCWSIQSLSVMYIDMYMVHNISAQQWISVCYDWHEGLIRILWCIVANNGLLFSGASHCMDIAIGALISLSTVRIRCNVIFIPILVYNFRYKRE